MDQIFTFLKQKLNGKVIAGIFIGFMAGALWSKIKPKTVKRVGILDLIGNTPLVYLPKLSKHSNCHIYVKMEMLNPFGSSKDRAVKQFLTTPAHVSDNEVVEASSGSTAISLVQMAHIVNKHVTLYLPNDLSEDKYLLLQTLKAKIVKVPPVSIVDSNHFFNLAQKHGQQKESYFTNQFENLQNAKTHYQTTAPELYEQTEGKINSFICGAGTGGTLAGVSKYMKEKNKNIKIILADPEGSGLFNKVKYGVLFTKQEKEGYRLKNPFDTVVEGVGLNRATANFDNATLDDAFKITDQQVLHMAYYLIENQGLFVGGSTAMNLVAAVLQGRKEPGSIIVTIAHDSGIRYLKKLYSEDYLHSKGIKFKKRENYPEDDLSFIY